MCAGSEYSGTFDRCMFEGCTIYAVHGACLSLSLCHLHRSMPAVIASGCATTVSFSSCAFEACRAAVIADRGASVAIQTSSVINCQTGLIVNDPGSHADMDGSIAQVDNAVSASVCTIKAWGGAGVSARGCRFSGLPHGVCASQPGTTVELRDTRIERCVRAVEAMRQACVSLTGVDVFEQCYSRMSRAASAAPCAVRLGGLDDPAPAVAAVQLQMHRCRVQAAYGAGVQLLGGKADVLLCEFACPEDAVYVGDRAHSARMRFCVARTSGPACQVRWPSAVLTVEHCTLHCREGSCVAGEGGTLVVADSELDGQSAAKISAVAVAMAGASLALLRCTLRDGVLGVNGRQSTARIVDTVVSGMRRRVDRHSMSASEAPTLGAACVFEGCEVDVVRGAVRDCVFGVTALRGDAVRPAPVRMHGVCFDGCAHTITIMPGVSVDIGHCKFVGCDVGRAVQLAKEAGVHASSMPSVPGAVICGHAESVAVHDCTFDGPWAVMCAGGTSPVRIADCVFKSMHASARKDAFVTVSAAAVIVRSSFSGTRTGVTVDTGAKAVIRECTMGPEVEIGVQIGAGGGAAVAGCSFRQCRRGLFAWPGSDLTVEDCTCVDTREGVNMDGGTLKATGLVVTGATAGVLGRSSSRGKATVTLHDCSFTRCMPYAVIVGDTGVTATIRRCVFEQLGCGVAVHGTCIAHVQSSTMRQCMVGLRVGFGMDDLRDRACPLCGRRGQAGFEHALRALAQPPARRGCCMHEGAVARATAEDVCVDSCTVQGVLVNVSGHLVAKRVRVADSGVQVFRAGKASVFEELGVTSPDKVEFWRLREGTDEMEREEPPDVNVITCGPPARPACA